MEIYRREHGVKPMSENKECASYLGVYVTERAILPLLPNAKRMPMHHPKYDYLCSKGYKVDIKSGVAHQEARGNLRWKFKIAKNKVADYFLCVAYNNREDLKIAKIWLFPGHFVNNQTMISITTETIDKWKQYEIDSYDVSQCVDKIKSIGETTFP